MERTRLGYWGPALIVLGLIALAVSLALFQPPVIYWAVMLSVAVAVVGLVLVAYKRLG